MKTQAGAVAWCLWLGLNVAHPVAASGPENVAVVVNDTSALSRSIAEYYARRRAIPASNVCHVRSPETEEISHAEYQANISGTRHEWKGAIPNPFYGQRAAQFAHPRFPIYLVTRLAGYDFAAARALVDRSIEAQNPRYHGQGKIVIDLKLYDSTSGNEWLRDASLRVPQDRLVFDESAKVLSGLTDVIAYASWGSNDPSRKKRNLGFKWLPGAIMTEFVSSNGRTFRRLPDTWNIGSWGGPRETWYAGSPQTLTADYIEEGATGASGHVAEPFLHYCPRPEILIPEYLKGRNLAESYYLAIPGLSWQNIVIGDPLAKLP